MKKKLLPALLALVMVLGLLPLAAFAAPEDTGPVVDGYGFIWDATKANLGLVEGAKTSGDWMNETMYVYFSNTGSDTTNLWFQIQVGQDTWGCAANGSKGGAASTYAFSFLNRGTQWELHPTIQSETFDYSGNSVTHAGSYMKGSNTVTLSVYTPTNAIKGEQKTEPAADALGKAIFTQKLTLTKNTDINQKVENTPEEPEAIAVAKSVFIVKDETSYNKLPQSYLKNYPFETYKDSAVPTFPWLVATYSRKSASALTYEVTKDSNAVTLPQGSTATPAKANDDAYIMWRITDKSEGLKQDDPYGTYTVSVKLQDQTVELGKVTFTAPAADDPIEGTVAEGTLSVKGTQVDSAVTGQVEDSTATEVKIEVQAPSAGDSGKAPTTVEVPLSTTTLGALENVTKPVVIDTPQGGVAVEAKTLIGKIAKDDEVTFKMENTTKDDAKGAETYTYTVGFYKKAQEVEVKGLPANTITLTFKTSFAKDTEVLVRGEGDTGAQGITVGESGVVTVTTTHLSKWTITKRATANVTFVPQGKLTGDNAKYYYGKLTISGLTDSHYYLVALTSNKVVSDGKVANICQVLTPKSGSIVIPCQSGLNLKLYDVTKGDSFEIPARFKDEQIIYGGEGKLVDNFSEL